jgi:hypothetical protein
MYTRIWFIEPESIFVIYLDKQYIKAGAFEPNAGANYVE